MVILKDDAFYRYIYKANGGYIISKNNEHYGWYDDLPTALYDRDRLEQVDWDIQTWTELIEVPNPYEYMELPPFGHEAKYITKLYGDYIIQDHGKHIAVFHDEDKARAYAKENGYQVYFRKPKYRIQKRVNGKLLTIDCPSFDEALEKRDELIKKEWKL